LAKYGPKPKPIGERFWPKVKKTKGCWLWEGTKNNMGYGMFMRVSPKKELAHRVSWALAYGSIPPGKNILHKCDNPACVRPDHLFIGTKKDNTQDMVKKGRNKYVAHPGEKNGNAKLTKRKVLEIRGAYETGKISQTALAELYGVSQALIGFVITRRAWKHVK